MAKARKGKGKGYIIPQDDEPVTEVTVDVVEFILPEVQPQAEVAVAEAIEQFDSNVAEMQAEAEVEADNAKPNSVVAPKFKDKYLANARALGIPGKAAKRSNWDWLSQQIAAQALTEKHKLKVAEFLALLDANQVDHSRWTNRNKGWEGRLRMTGRVALQKKVANANELVLLDGGTVTPPEEWAAKFRDKE